MTRFSNRQKVTKLASQIHHILWNYENTFEFIFLKYNLNIKKKNLLKKFVTETELHKRRTYASNLKYKQLKWKKLHVESITIRLLNTSRFSLISPHRQCKATPWPIRSIYMIPTALRKIIWQTCHSRTIKDEASTKKTNSTRQ